jgi:hypothetical protein
MRPDACLLADAKCAVLRCIPILGVDMVNRILDEIDAATNDE